MNVPEWTLQAIDKLWNMMYHDALLSKVLFGLLGCYALYLIFYSLFMRMRHRWDSTYFILLCSSVLVWTTCSLLTVLEWGDAVILEKLSIMVILPIPALLCLHVRQQVSYKEHSVVFTILLLTIPVLLILLMCRDLFFPQVLISLPAAAVTPWYSAVFYLYTIIALVRSYLLCFNVFYQMPRRTRRSTRYMLLSITAIILFLVLDALWSGAIILPLAPSEMMEILSPLVMPTICFFILYPLYSAMRVMPASEVIVTSREFVIGSLSTAILILNQKKRILDWNKMAWGENYALPTPKFREHIDLYRQRVLEGSGSRVSPHEKDIIIVENGGIEKYFYISSHEAGNKKRTFGYIVEVTEVTQLYTLLRHFEDIAYHDHLTKLYNRNAYLELVNTIVVEKNMPLLIFVGDVNKLKILNDVHGHLLGDELLVTVANIILKAMPKNAFIARIGGDEFVMLVPEGSKEIAEKFVKDMIVLCSQTHHEVFGSPTVSWGYALMNSTEESYNEVFSRADEIMYQYKKARHEFHSSGLLPDSNA